MQDSFKKYLSNRSVTLGDVVFNLVKGVSFFDQLNHKNIITKNEELKVHFLEWLNKSYLRNKIFLALPYEKNINSKSQNYYLVQGNLIIKFSLIDIKKPSGFLRILDKYNCWKVQSRTYFSTDTVITLPLNSITILTK